MFEDAENAENARTGKSVLDVEVSCFAAARVPRAQAIPHPVNVLTWLTSTSPKYAKLAQEVAIARTIKDKTERNEIKKNKPVIMINGIFTGQGRLKENFVKHSGLVQIDIDKDHFNESILNWDEVGNELRNLENVAYCGLSFSGNAYWCIIPIAYPELYERQYKALIEDFLKLGISIDSACGHATQPRTYAYDANGYFNHAATLYTRVAAIPQPRQFVAMSSDPDTDAGKVEDGLRQLEAINGYMGETEPEWHGVARAFANVFGEAGRDYFHRASCNHSGYTPGATDKKYNGALRNPGNATLGTVFHWLSQYGIEIKSTPKRESDTGLLLPTSPQGLTVKTHPAPTAQTDEENTNEERPGESIIIDGTAPPAIIPAGWTVDAQGTLIDANGLPYKQWYCPEDYDQLTAPELAFIYRHERVQKIAADFTPVAVACYGGTRDVINEVLTDSGERAAIHRAGDEQQIQLFTAALIRAMLANPELENALATLLRHREAILRRSVEPMSNRQMLTSLFAPRAAVA
jgi:hypothetical protein